MRGDRAEAQHSTLIRNATPEDPNSAWVFERYFRMQNSSNSSIINCTVEESIQDAFVLCCSENCDPTKHGDDIGPYCVEIADPLLFFWHVVEAFVEVKGVDRVLDGVAGKVSYRSRQSIDQQPGLLGFVKPPDPWASQQEVRLIILPKNIQGELVPFNLKMPGIAGICRRIA